MSDKLVDGNCNSYDGLVEHQTFVVDLVPLADHGDRIWNKDDHEVQIQILGEGQVGVPSPDLETRWCTSWFAVVDFVEHPAGNMSGYTSHGSSCPVQDPGAPRQPTSTLTGCNFGLDDCVETPFALVDLVGLVGIDSGRLSSDFRFVACNDVGS